MDSLRSGLMDYWRLWEASGNSESTVGRNTLTDNNTVTGNPGIVLNARQFTRASSERLSLASTADVQSGDIDFTVACWVYLDSTPAGIMYAMGKDGTGAGTREWRVMWNNADSLLTFSIFKAVDTAASVTAATLGAPATATWYFITAWHDAVGDTVNIEVNMGGADSAATGGAAQAASTAEFAIGARSAGTLFWDGRICEAAKWNRILSRPERWWLYNSGKGRSYPFDGRMSLAMMGRGRGQMGRRRSHASGIIY